ncbi:MAG: hypothetical protein Kow00124_24340 [Anaerolineae bacterium]
MAIEQAAVYVGAEAERKGVRFLMTLDPHLAVMSSRQYPVSYIFVRLLKEAVMHSPEGGRVWVSAGRLDGRAAAIEVRDESRGQIERRQWQLLPAQR